MADLDQRVTDLAQATGAECKSIREQVNGLTKVVQITQADYDALPTKDANTLYVVIG